MIRECPLLGHVGVDLVAQLSVSFEQLLGLGHIARGVLLTQLGLYVSDPRLLYRGKTAGTVK